MKSDFGEIQKMISHYQGMAEDLIEISTRLNEDVALIVKATGKIDTFRRDLERLRDEP